jgi:hypothetical protein
MPLLPRGESPVPDLSLPHSIRRGDSSSGVNDRVLAQLLTEIDGGGGVFQVRSSLSLPLYLARSQLAREPRESWSWPPPIAQTCSTRRYSDPAESIERCCRSLLCSLINPSWLSRSTFLPPTPSPGNKSSRTVCGRCRWLRTSMCRTWSL